jgi:hypothetical protein
MSIGLGRNAPSASLKALASDSVRWHFSSPLSTFYEFINHHRPELGAVTA